MERALREVHGSLLVAVPRELAKRRGWKAGDRMLFGETKAGVVLDRAEPERGIAYTVGYEGRTLDEFLTLVKGRDIRRVIDVRERPLSRKRGFSKRELEHALGREGIGYVPLRELGSPSPARRDYRSGGSFRVFARRYQAHLGSQRPSLEILRALSAEAPSAILCFERDWQACHRSVLASYLGGEGFRLEHL